MICNLTSPDIVSFLTQLWYCIKNIITSREKMKISFKELLAWDVIVPYLIILVSWGYFTFFVVEMVVPGIIIGIIWTTFYVLFARLIIKIREKND